MPNDLHVKYVIEDMVQELYECHTYEGDFSDLGNEIGFALGKVCGKLTKEQIRDFMFGLEHGIDSSNRN